MIRLSGPRCLAMSVVGSLFGWWASKADVSTMAHYQGLTHEALLSELASRNDGVLSTNIMGGLLVVVAIVLAVDVLTRFFKVIWTRIEPPSSAGRNPNAPTAAA
jgi:hypothetical protein